VSKASSQFGNSLQHKSGTKQKSSESKSGGATGTIGNTAVTNYAGLLRLKAPGMMRPITMASTTVKGRPVRRSEQPPIHDQIDDNNNGHHGYYARVGPRTSLRIHCPIMIVDEIRRYHKCAPSIRPSAPILLKSRLNLRRSPTNVNKREPGVGVGRSYGGNSAK
jgi:hypothetical protein